MMPALIRGMSLGEAEPRARAVLERVGLGERLTHKPGRAVRRRAAACGRGASGGAVAAAWCSPMSRPATSIPTTGAEVQRLLMDLNREQHITLIIVTHNEALPASAHRTLRLQDGQLR